MAEIDPTELQEWLDSLDYILETHGPGGVQSLLHTLNRHALQHGIRLPFTAKTPYINTIPVEHQVPFPGSQEIRRRIRNISAGTQWQW